MANREKIERLQDLIKDTIGGEIVEQKVESLLPPGENYGSVMYKVDFKVRRDDKDEEFHAVAKCTPLNTITQDFFNTQVTFKSEIGWYTTVIPTLKQFQRDQGVEREIDFFQKFYGARISLDPTSETVDLDGVILTQNINYLGYHNIDRHLGFDLPTTYSILRDLATFHAVPLAIKIKNAELFIKNIKPYLTRLGDFDDVMQQEFNKGMLNVFEHIPECQPMMERIKKNISQANVFGVRSLREPWVTVIHMDFWVNNIMVTGGENSNTIILDLQVPCLGSPAGDLAFFLLTSVNLDVIRDNFDDFVKFYFKEFSNNLKQLNVPTEEYTYKGLLEEIKLEVGLGEFSHSLGHSQMILQEKGVLSDIDPSNANFKMEDMANIEKSVNERQIEKFRWLASEAVDRKWI